MNGVSALFVVHYYIVASSGQTNQTRYTGFLFSPIKQAVMSTVKNWNVAVKLPNREAQDYFRKKERDRYVESKKRKGKELEDDIPRYVRPYSQIRYEPVMPQGDEGVPKPDFWGITLHPLQTTYHLFRRTQYAYQHFQQVYSRPNVRLDDLFGRRELRFTTASPSRDIPYNISEAKYMPDEEIPDFPGVLGWDIIFANLDRPKSKGVQLKPGLGDFKLERPTTITVKDGFRIIFPEDAKDRIVGITINANKNRAFKGVGDNTKGEIVLNAELMTKQNMTKWVATYRNGSYLKNHDVIFYWYVYSLKVEDKTYKLYSYDNYFRLYYEFLVEYDRLPDDPVQLLFAPRKF